MNTLFNTSAMGRLSNGQRQEAVCEAGITLQQHLLEANQKADQESRDKLDSDYSKSIKKCWESGYKSGRKIKVHLRKVGENGYYSYKITIGKGFKPIFGKWLTKDPVKAIENGYKRVTAIWGSEL